jgi:predicted metal-dependent HD superfamily phosphohydrolase
MRRKCEPLALARWSALMGRLGLVPHLDTFERLQAAYSEKHRHYHTTEHINQCLEMFDSVRHLARQPGEVELALWFHDAIYLTRSQSNEAKSAQWAEEFLRASGADTARARRVHDLILCTKHDATSDDPDSMLLVDIDLAVLGADPATCEIFERNVRQEYRWVPRALFNRTRAAILQSFLDRPAVYATTHFRQQLENRARENLRTAVTALTT